MTVSSVKNLFHRLAKLPSHDGHEAPSHEVLHTIETALHPYLDLSLEAFAELLSKVKKPKPPKKTAEEKAAEKAAKASEKLAAKAAKAEETKRLKAEKAAETLAAKEADKQRKAADKIAAKEAAKQSKIAEKEAEKARKVEWAAQGRIAKLADTEAKKANAIAEKIAAEARLAESVGRELQALVGTFTGGGVPKATVDEGLAKLKLLGKPQLMIVAKQLNADAGLDEESSKGKISKAIETSVLRLWKTSDNVTH